MNTVTFKIDGISVQAQEGQSVLSAALAADIYIPHLCHHPDLTDIGVCGLCLVEYDHQIVSSCTLPAEDGMEIHTKGEELEERRKLALKLLLAAHPEDCSTCPKYGKCELQTLMQYMGVSPEGLNRRLKPLTLHTENSMIVQDMARCVLCGRCVRACQKFRGVGAIDYQKQKEETFVGALQGGLLMDAGCRFCGSCVEVCPTGALMYQPEPHNPENWVVPCREACPAHTDVPRYVRYIKEGKYDQAIAVIREKLPFPQTLGYVCNHVCEGACRRTCLNEAVSIRNVKRFAAEHDKNQGWKKKRKFLPDTGKRVAVVGAGPAGLSAAYYLCKQGHDITVFEALPVAGGIPRVGIPEYRLPREVVQEEVDVITEIGVKIQLNTPVADYQALLKDFDAVLVAVGAHNGVRLPIDGNQLPEVYTNIEFLTHAALNRPDPIGKTVLVLGGGNVAFDCARTSRRLGAQQVNMACLEGPDTVPGSADEIAAAGAEGIHLYYKNSFVKILSRDGHVSGVEMKKVTFIGKNQDGQFVIETEPDSNFVLPCDTVIFATGQKPVWPKDSGFQLFRGAWLQCDQRQMTNVEGIFGAGDCVYGTQSVVKAVAHGRSAASVIDQYLGGDGDISEVLVKPENPCTFLGKENGFAEQHRVQPEERAARERVQDFALVESTFTTQQARCESGRCLQCDLREQLHESITWNDFEKGETV